MNSGFCVKKKKDKSENVKRITKKDYVFKSLLCKDLELVLWFIINSYPVIF